MRRRREQARPIEPPEPGGSGGRTAWAIGLLLVLSIVAAAAPPPTSGDLALAQVHAGMTGYGLTAGPDNALEQFAVTVLSVQQDAGPGFPLVLVRASGSFIDRSGGVSAGMSGSPVYLATSDGARLLGAIGYVFPSADHHLALVTPIATMRRVTSASAGPSAVAVSVPGLGAAVPVSTPLLLSGLGPRGVALLSALFRRAGVDPFPVQAAGTLPPGQDPPYAIEPGSPVSVELVRGDVTIGAVGTITSVDNGEVLAFGHPLLGIGAVALPLAPAYITAVVPSSVVPFKLANSGQTPLGTVAQDRPAGIAGSLGAGPPMVPVALTVQAPAGTTTYHLDVAADERLYPQLVAAAGQEVLDRSLAETTGGYAQIGWELDLAGGDQLNLVQQVDDATDIARATAQELAAPLKTLATNPFRAPGLSSLKVNVVLSDHRKTAEIADVVAENPDVTAGTSLVAHIRLQPFRQDPIVKTLSVPIPTDATNGTVTLTFRGGSVTPKVAADTPPPKPSDRPRSFPELLDAMRQRPQASELVVEMPGPDGRPRRLARLALPFVVTGSQTLDITVSGGTTPSQKPTGNSDGGTAPSAPGAPSNGLGTPPSATPPGPPEPPKPNGDGSSGGSRQGGGV